MSFQPDAFQQDGFQRGPLEPRPLVPSDAFQGDAFQVGAIVSTGPGTAPSISSHPAGQTIAAGSSANLSVTASGTAPLTYQWYEGLSGDTSNPISGQVFSSTSVSPVVDTNYWVRVTNAYGTADSNTAAILVSPAIVVQPQSQAALVGASVVLTVSAIGPALTYQWYEGTSGDTSNPLGGETNTSLTVTFSVAINYWVRVTNGNGSVDSNTASLTIDTGRKQEAGRPSKSRKRKRYLVEIDGETFDVDSPDEARRVLSIAKEALQEQIEQPVKKAKNGKLPVNKPRIRVTGLPGPELKEIVQAIAGIRDEISQMYRDAARTAEIAYLIAKKRKQDDEEAILLLM